MPVVFAGHGSPMLALEESDVTRGLAEIGMRVREGFGAPKAILAVSAHWYTKGTRVQSALEPRQVYDMSGFPQELYDCKYPVKGCPDLSRRVQELLGERVDVDDSWGIDHGSWTVLCHMFPEADIPVVQLSVDATLSHEEIYGTGHLLSALRDEGYLIFASGNVVHNLWRILWDYPYGTKQCVDFDNAVIDLMLKRDDAAVMDYRSIKDNDYAVPTPDHYLPLIYMLGATEGEVPEVFNRHREMGAIAMTGYAFGMDV